MRLGENNHKRPQGSHKIHYIKNFELNLNSFLETELVLTEQYHYFNFRK